MTLRSDGECVDAPPVETRASACGIARWERQGRWLMIPPRCRTVLVEPEGRRSTQGTIHDLAGTRLDVASRKAGAEKGGARSVPPGRTTLRLATRIAPSQLT